MSWESHLDQIIARHQELADRMATGQHPAAEFVAMSQEYAEISPLVEKITLWKDGQREIADLQEMTNDPDMDGEMRSLALVELQQAKKNQVEMENALQYALIPSNAKIAAMRFLRFVQARAGMRLRFLLQTSIVCIIAMRKIIIGR